MEFTSAKFAPVELDSLAHQAVMEQHEQLLALVRQNVGNTAVQQHEAADTWVSNQEYSHSMQLLGEVGEIITRCGRDSVEAQIAIASLRECFDSSVIEMLHTDKQFREKLEINRERKHMVRDGRVMAHDGKTVVLNLCINGAERSAQDAAEDPRSIPVAERCAADVRNARAVELMPIGAVRVGISMDPKEAMARYGKAFYEDLGFREDVAFLQWYCRIDKDTLLAATYSVDSSDIPAMREMWSEFGGEIPEGEATNTWLDHAIEKQLTLEEAREMVLQMRNNFYQKRNIDIKRYSTDEFVAINKPAKDEMFELYLQLAVDHHLHMKGGAMHAFAESLLQDPHSIRKGIRQRLDTIYHNHLIDKDDAALLEQLVRYATAERLREGLKLLGTTKRPQVEALVAPPGMSQAAFVAQRAGNLVNVGAKARRTYGGCTKSIDLSGDGENKTSDNDGLRPQEAFGGNDEGENYQWVDGICRIGNCPTRPETTKVGPCRVCRKCQRIFNRGRDPAKIYARYRSIQEATFKTYAANLLTPVAIEMPQPHNTEDDDPDDDTGKTKAPPQT